MNILYNICFGQDIYGDSLFNIGQVSLRIHRVYSMIENQKLSDDEGH